MKNFLCAILFLTVLGTNIGSAQLYINEFMASNSSTIEDPDFSDNSDWIEIYNSSDEIINLETYFITDSKKLPAKWALPSVDILPQGFVIVWADNESTGLHSNFKLSSSGEFIGLYASNMEVIDSLSYSLQERDISLGRLTDGNSQFGFILSPTPGFSNEGVTFKGVSHHTPEFDIRGGLYQDSQTIKITNERGGEIRYTLDGSEPNINSSIVPESIIINKTTVVRSRVFEKDLIPGPVITHTYFIGEGFEQRGLPVFSISSEPDNFWGATDGIYVQSFKPEWEIPINIEFFENDGSDRAAFNELAGTKINGLNSWVLPQKMLGISFRKQYGSSSLDYNLFPDSERSSFSSFSLRASGSDWSYTLFRDALAQTIANDFMGIDIQKYRPAIVFINGEYMGIANIREKIDGDYIEENYTLPDGSFDIIENTFMVEEGSLTNYREFDVLLDRDLSIQSNYEAVEQGMDITNFTDYAILQTYDNNTSIAHNIFSWKPKLDDKWKFILVDTDRGFFNASQNLIDHYRAVPTIPLEQLLANSEYKTYFAQRFADQLYTTLNTSNIVDQINIHRDGIKEEMPNHIERWEGATSSEGNAMPSLNYWEEQVGLLKNFAEDRPFYLFNSLSSLCGLDSTVQVGFGVYPENAAEIKFNDQLLHGSNWSGLYPKGLNVTFSTNANAGYRFEGWASCTNENLISNTDTWKYEDSGVIPGEDWNESSFEDGSWGVGSGPFGEGGTELITGHVTNYFRKSFDLTSQELDNIAYVTLNIIRNDGVVIYLNGKELLRSNMKDGAISNTTESLTEGSTRTYSYQIDKTEFIAGTNVLAVEIHQRSNSETDFQFDLELVAGKFDASNLVSTDLNYIKTIVDDLGLVAIYSATTSCFIPEVVSSDLTLSKDCSPYLLSNDILIEEGVTLTIEPGVELLLSPDVQITINGALLADGNSTENILFKINPTYEGQSWGGLNFIHTSNTSFLKYVIFEDASKGENATTAPAAISAFFADLDMDHLVMLENYGNPIHARYSAVTLTNSFLHSSITGDLINVKYGDARVENCEFKGNNQPDTDAIDYDDVENGVIKNCIIYDFLGDNSDGIDIGEKAKNIRIDSVWIVNVTDKGVSVGQQSSASVSNSTFVNCSLGFGLKDSSNTNIDHCTFYNNGTPVACFEKNIGSAGGNAIVTNSIFSNSYDDSYSVDEFSSLSIKTSISDNDSLPEDVTNVFGNPQFESPSFFNYTPSQEMQLSERGSIMFSIDDAINVPSVRPSLMINEIYVVGPDSLEFIGIYNPSDIEVDLSGFEIDKGFTFAFPNGSEIAPQTTIYLTNDMVNTVWESLDNDIYEWVEGRLSDNGEGIRLQNNYGITEDYIRYDNDGSWPSPLFVNEYARLKDVQLDNHFGENWSSKELILVGIKEEINNNRLSIYPNPTKGIITVVNQNSEAEKVLIYSALGELLSSVDIKDNGEEIMLDVSLFDSQVLILKVGSVSERVIVFP